jgi:streptogramin lyase
MKLYTVTDKSKKILAWAGTQGDARAARRDMNAHSWQPFDVPTSKAEFLGFLNEHAVAPQQTDND